MFFKKKKEQEKMQEERRKRLTKFLDECRKHTDFLNNSQAVKRIARKIKESGGCDWFEVFADGITCGGNHQVRISFQELGLKALSDSKFFVNTYACLPIETIKDDMWLESFKARNKDFYGLYFKMVDSEWDPDGWDCQIHLDERMVVGYAVASLLWSHFSYEFSARTYYWENINCARFTKNKPELKDWE